MSQLDSLERVECRTRAEWRAWLEAHHRQSESVWLVTFKKGSGQPYLAYAEGVEEALCFGWIDSRPGKLDEQRTMLRYSPRKPNSVWAKTNKERVERLIREGRMTAAGLAKIEEAKRNGSWTVLDNVENAIVPEDLKSALRRNRVANQNWEAFSLSARKQTLQWIQMAKTPGTRAKRVAETVRLAALNEKPNQTKARP